MPRRTKEQKQKLATLLASGVKVGKALREAGYPEQTARKGMAVVPADVIKMLPVAALKKGEKLMAIGRNLTAQAQEELARGRLAHNTIVGSDKGAQSAKILGSDRRVNMFTPDTQIGVITLVAPQEMIENKAQMLAELEAGNPPKGSN